MLTDAEAKMEGKRIKVPDEKPERFAKMRRKDGRKGWPIQKICGLLNYPECKNTKPIVVAAPGECPLCKGRILEKKSKEVINISSAKTRLSANL